MEGIDAHVEPQAGNVKLAVRAFTFFKDNEYFNKIVDGYTLFGTQLNLQLVYYPTEGLRLEAGVFLWKDFGNPVLQQVRPTYRATWTVNKHQFILGNILPNLSHNYIEPLFNFERVMLKPLEEGLQYRYLGNRLFLDVWVDWLRQQYRYSNYQEEIAGGLSSRYRFGSSDSRWQVAVPFQFTAQHHGGQIDTLRRPLQTLFNEAVGIEIRRSLGNPKVQALRFNGYVLGFQDHSLTDGQLPFKYGRGLYLNTTLETRYADVMLSYWQGSRFIAPLGGDLFQSASRTVSNPEFLDRQRKILLVRLLRFPRLGRGGPDRARRAAVRFHCSAAGFFVWCISEFSAGVAAGECGQAGARRALAVSPSCIWWGIHPTHGSARSDGYCPRYQCYETRAGAWAKPQMRNRGRGLRLGLARYRRSSG